MSNETALPLWLVAASLALNALFLRRLLAKLDKLYDWIVGTMDRPGLIDRVVALESWRSDVLVRLDQVTTEPWPGSERRQGERRRGAP